MTFYEKIKNQVALLKNQFNYKDEGTAFGHFVIKECFNKIVDFGFDGLDFDDYINKHNVDMAHDCGNDLIFTKKDSKQILIFQTKFSENRLLNTNDIKKNKKFIDWMLHISEEEEKPNPKLKDIIDREIYPILKEKNYSIIVFYIDNSFDEHIKTDIKALYNNFKEKEIDLEIKFYNYEEVEELYEDVEIPKNKIELVIAKERFIKDIMYHDKEDETTPLNTIVTSVKAKSLKKVIEDKKELLLTLNVRYYKGENEINSKIKDEYSKGKKSNFWILNNGINAICKDFHVGESNDTIEITNFQIVNGGQTAKTLSRLSADPSDDIEILMRLTKIKDITKISKISKNIAFCSNSQNAISTRDQHSGDSIQRRISDQLNEVGIFYDKKCGEWSTVEKKKYKNNLNKTPLYLKIDNTEMGKAYMSFFLQEPISTKGRDKLVFSETLYDEIFDFSKNFEEHFSKLIFAFRLSEKINMWKSKRENKYEILQNQNINDVLLSLMALHFFGNNEKLVKTPKNLKDEINSLKFISYTSKENLYQLKSDPDLETFFIKLTDSLQYLLDVKKESSKDWMPKDTNNWLKKDKTYEEILLKVIDKLKREE